MPGFIFVPVLDMTLEIVRCEERSATKTTIGLFSIVLFRLQLAWIFWRVFTFHFNLNIFLLSLSSLILFRIFLQTQTVFPPKVALELQKAELTVTYFTSIGVWSDGLELGSRLARMEAGHVSLDAQSIKNGLTDQTLILDS